jgi:hypothetical protein
MLKIFNTINYEWFNGVFPSTLRKMIPLFLIIILIAGCQSPRPTDSDGVPSIAIEVNKNGTALSLSEITEKVDVIELETNDHSFIDRGIRQVDVLDGHIIIKDASPGVLVFDMQGKFVRRIGQLGQGPRELSGGYTYQVDQRTHTIRFQLFQKFLIFDVNGTFIEDKRKEVEDKDIFTSALNANNPFYYLNDSLFVFKEELENVNVRFYNQYVSFNIYEYSSGNLLNSLFFYKYKELEGMKISFKKIFQYKNQAYMFYSREFDQYDTVFTIKNLQLVPFARIILPNIKMNNNIYSLAMRDLFVSNRYVGLVLYSRKNSLPDGAVMTPEISRVIRQTMRDHSPDEDIDVIYFIYDYKDGTSINSYDGFIDDIHHTNEIVPIKFIDGGEKFFYTRENEYVEALRTEPNPTLYIGTFKK